jgi:hypothetical protein
MTKLPYIAVLGDTVVFVFEGYTETRILGMKPLQGLHDLQPGQKEIADALGLPPDKMNSGHDLTHSLLAHWCGLPYSPSLASAAGGPKVDEALSGAEEDAVKAIQRYLSLLGKHPTDLVRNQDLRI